MTNREIEDAFVKAFIAPTMRKRALHLLSKRDEWVNLDEAWLRREYATQIPRGDQYPEQIHALLKQQGAGDFAYCIGSGERVSIRDYLEANILDCEFILVCKPRHLVYWQNDHLTERYIFKR